MEAARSSREDESSRVGNGIKRAAPAPTDHSPPAKRGKVSEKERKSIEELMGKGEDDETVAEQISGFSKKSARVVKGNLLQDGEKNAFDQVSNSAE